MLFAALAGLTISMVRLDIAIISVRNNAKVLLILPMLSIRQIEGDKSLFVKFLGLREVKVSLLRGFSLLSIKQQRRNGDNC